MFSVVLIRSLCFEMPFAGPKRQNAHKNCVDAAIAVMLFHSRKTACETLVMTLKNKGIETVCDILRTLNI